MPNDPKRLIENVSPQLAARIDVVLLALVTSLKLHEPQGFESALRANVQLWRDHLIATRVCEAYLDVLDERLESMLAMLRG